MCCERERVGPGERIACAARSRPVKVHCRESTALRCDCESEIIARGDRHTGDQQVRISRLAYHATVQRALHVHMCIHLHTIPSINGPATPTRYALHWLYMDQTDVRDDSRGRGEKQKIVLSIAINLQ